MGLSAGGASRVWIFDLDNTLHDARPHIFPHINRSMTEYVARLLDLGAKEADELRDSYWRRYGATLTGLIRHHAVDPGHFLRETHHFPDIDRMVTGRTILGRHESRRDSSLYSRLDEGKSSRSVAAIFI